MDANGILLLYYHPPAADASTIMEHVNAFARHSRFKVWNVNTYLGRPASLPKMRFSVIALHYSLFGNWPFALNNDFLIYLAQSVSSYKIAFFQDEYHYCRPRFDFLNRYKIDSVYTLLEPQYWKDVYLKYTSVSKLVCHLPGYVSEEMLAAANKFHLPVEDRTIDVGYRARPLPFYMGAGAQEKTGIALGFLQRAGKSNLRLDIQTEEKSRLYGEAWHRFLANCRAVLGVEAGVSLFDVEDAVRPAHDRLLAENPQISFAEMSRRLLQPLDGNIPYRMLSPRHFEAAAFGVCQILFEGSYSGLMKPMTHYLPLKKDFSNFDEVVKLFKDEVFRSELTKNAHRDLIASGLHSYRKIIHDFDQELEQAGFQPQTDEVTAAKVAAALRREKNYLAAKSRFTTAVYSSFPGRKVIAFFARPVLNAFRRLKRGPVTPVGGNRGIAKT